MKLRRAILIAMVLAAGCATPEVQVLVKGETACFEVDRRVPLERCKALVELAKSLNTPAMDKAIAEARK